jgi:hypothetical protein
LWSALCTTSKVISQIQYSRGRTGFHFHRFSTRVFTTLPSSCFPTEALERHLGFTRLPSHGIDPSPTFEHFLSIHPEWSRHLLPTLAHNISFGENFQLFSCPCSSRIAACHVQCNLFREPFGWVLVTSNPHRILVSMQWSGIWRLYGLLPRRSVWPAIPHHFLTFLSEIYFKSRLPPTDIWCDYPVVVKTVNKIWSRKRPEFHNETLTPSWDILQAIRTKFRLNPDLSTSRVIRTSLKTQARCNFNRN